MSLPYRLPRSTPEQQGIPSSAIMRFLDDAKQLDRNGQGLNSFMLVRYGHVAAEGWWSPYAAELSHYMFSLSKSFTSTAIGLAAAEGLLSVDDYIVSFFPEVSMNLEDRHLASMRVRHLLSMSTGHAEDTSDRVMSAAVGDWVSAFLKLAVEHEPGTKFVYNTAATYMLSAILQRVAGETLLDYLQSRLFGPLGIDKPHWEACPRGITIGGHGLSMRTEDIAKLGQLYLHDGVWQGERLLPEGWVDEAMSIQISNGDGGANDCTQGYGYQFWLCRHGAFRGDGSFGQFCVVIPEQDAVVAITSGVDDTQFVLNLVWEHLLPAMGSEPLAEDVQAHAALTVRLAGLEKERPSLNATSPLADEVNGRRYVMESNQQGVDALTFHFNADDGAGSIEWQTSNGVQTFRFGVAGWQEQRVDIWESQQLAMVSGTWRDEATFVLSMLIVETPFMFTDICRFEGTSLVVEASANVAFGSKSLGTMVGQAVNG